MKALRNALLSNWDGYASRFVLPNTIEARRCDDGFFCFRTQQRPHRSGISGSSEGLYTIGITSRRYSASVPSLHPSGKHLADVVDLVLDHDVPPGDTLVSIEEMPELGTTGGASTALAIIMVHAVFASVIENFVKAGEVPPMIRCPDAGVVQGALQANAKTLARYRQRLPHI